MKLFLALSMSCIVIVSVSGETFKECANLNSGSFVGGTKGCKSYIYCDGDDSYEGLCPSQLLFSTKDGSCAAPSDVDCKDELTTTITTTTKATTTTTTTTRRTSPTITNAPAIVEEVEENIEPSAEVEEVEEVAPSEPDTVIDVQTTADSFVTTTSIANGIGSTSRPAHSCPASDRPDEVIFLPSDVSCSEYFVCYHGTPVPMYCSGRLYFDYLTSKCELPERVNCKFGNLPEVNPKKKCIVNMFDYFPYPKNCNYFYKCMNGFLSLQQCPIGFGWSAERKLCLKLIQGRCPNRIAMYE